MGELEKVGNYEIIQSIRLGGRVMLLGYNPQDKEATYMTCYQHFNLMGEKTYPLAVASENYLEIMQEFLKRVQEQQQEAVAFREKRNVPIEMLGEEHCRQRGEDESLEGKLVIIAPASLAAEYRTADCQLGFAVGGFGCTPTARGRAVYFQELYSGDRCRWDSTDILGIADVSKLPDWAKNKLKEYERTQPKKIKGDTNDEPRACKYCRCMRFPKF